MNNKVVNCKISPVGHLDVLSRTEVDILLEQSQGSLYPLFRSCALAVLASGNYSDDGIALLERYSDFEIQVLVQERGIKLDIHNAPAAAFVEGKMITGIAELLFSVLRDIIYSHDKLKTPIDSSPSATNAVFHILRNAKLLHSNTDPNIVVCWGGHSIARGEYEYTKKVGYELGLRGLDICTGCGPGAMKGPMKGATIAHAKQRQLGGRYIGLTEPGIIAAESPNPIVNELVILPDIEKRLEAFVRTGHGFIVFPGGAGTAEEILYLLGILMHPDNQHIPFPLIFTGPESASDYFEQVDNFIKATLGKEASRYYQIIIDDQKQVANAMQEGIAEVRAFRKQHGDAYYFNWLLTIDHAFQQPFEPDHQNMAELALHAHLPKHELAANLRRAFSGIVAGNVKSQGVRAIAKHGPFSIHGEHAIMDPMDKLLQSFVEQQRMKLPGSTYTPCYKLVK
ncbi:hypothetical protein EDC56_0850 [Sinobacterium caligoides]|uniref:AMP nucleosidase n=1 Tax=Sinobacterium caligoides TaxID=933926 RepID=A0A3N2DZP9_9GAMM|nr:nucleotide 5'-monophosphate nucleosidase PpnN [Sinobacterium caligoides]ROS05320.1 hypothetical protein EDC56_0850 [Sinobacterium caligoides]